MLTREVIARKRDGKALSGAEIAHMVEGLTSGDVTEGQVAAFAMAVFFRGMEAQETVALTLAMRDSGAVVDWSGLPGPVTDKHSTGGVGDNVSLMLAPIVAACGAYVPMISGRGLGHTGGTLDKMDSIPGYRSRPDPALLKRAVRDVGCAIIGQTDDLAPADKRFYAIRDVTATVESIPLITASILSKKLAAGLQSLVLDVKCGNGAFMPTRKQAEALARSLVSVASGSGLPTTALITDMNQPLASAAGNANEVLNAIDFLTGAHRDPRLEIVTLALAGEMLANAGLAKSAKSGIAMARNALEDGRAAERFARMVAALGGPADLMDNPGRHLPLAKSAVAVPASRSGYVEAIATRDIGVAVVELGGGRQRAGDAIDPAVGIDGIVPIGTKVEKGDPLAIVRAHDSAAAKSVAARLVSVWMVADTAPNPTAAVVRRTA